MTDSASEPGRITRMAGLARRMAIAYGVAQRWFEWPGVDRARCAFLLRTRHGFREVAVRGKYWVDGNPRSYDEPYWWVVGAADARGRGDDILTMEIPDVELMNYGEAAATLGLSEYAVQYRVSRAVGSRPSTRDGRLDVLVVTPREWALFGAQVRAQAGDEEAAAEWLRLIGKLHPSPPSTSDVDGWTGPKPSPDPLPIPAEANETDRRHTALMIGHKRGWWAFRAYDLATTTYTVELANGVVRELPARGVLAWALGVADARGQGHLVAYRDGLG